MRQPVEQVRGKISAGNVRTWIGILLAVLLSLTVLRQGQLIAGIWFDGENSTTESESLYALSRVTAGQTLYLDYTQPPHVITAYMPLFYWTTEWIARGARSWWEMVVLARWSVYVFWVGIGVAVFALARQVKCEPRAALVAALLWGASELGQEWANSVRPDAAALFFSLAALWVYQRRQTVIHLAASIALLVVAALYKHTVLAPLAVILWEEVMNGRARRGIVAAGAWGAALAVVGIVAQVMTHGRFELNVFSSLAEAGPWLWTWALFVTALAMGAVAFWGATLACGSTTRQTGVGLWKRYFIIGLALAFVRSRIFGALTNHYLEPFAAGCVLTGVLVQELLALGPKDVVRWGRLCWLAVAVGVSLALLIDQTRQVIQPGRDRDVAPWEQFTAQLGKFDGPVLAEDGYVTVRSGRTPYMIDANKFAHLQRDGKFDDTELLRRIEKGGFSAIITRFRIDAALRPTWAFPPRWLAPMRRRYDLSATYVLPGRDQTFYVYVPGGIQ
jgi:hypothetical protein